MRSLDEMSLIADIADDLPVGVWVAKSPSGAFVYANRAFAEIMGMPALADPEAGGYASPYGIHQRNGELYPEDRMPFAQALRRKTTVVLDDIVIHRSDGRRAFIRAVARPMLDSQGEVTHISIAFTDITEEVRANAERDQAQAQRGELLARELAARKQIKTAEDRLGYVLAHMPVLLFASDAQGIIIVAEGKGLAAQGWSSETFLGRSVFDMYGDHPQILADVRSAMRGETVTDVIHLGGSHFETVLTPMRDERGEVAGLIAVATDVTERQSLQARLMHAERLASMGTLAATIAHEINNPLTYLIGNLELLSDEALEPPRSAPMTDEGRAMLAEARDGAHRVLRIVRGLKEFSRGDVPGETCDVVAVIERSIAMVSNEIRHRARLVTNFGRVPHARADEVRLSQVFTNLLLNAAQAIPLGDSAAHQIGVTTSFEASSDSVLISISDSGVGMSPSVMLRIFEPFFTTKPAGVGTGLGLSVCQEIVKGFGGQISVESEPTRGTCFRVRLPAEPFPSSRAPSPGDPA